MYSKGDYIVYGNAGVYSVEDITTLSGVGYAEKNKKYYVLKPKFSSGVVYYPTDSDKISIRPIMTKEEAEKIINSIPEMEVEIKEFYSNNELSECYKSLLKDNNPENLIRAMLFIEKRKEIAAVQKRKFGSIDESYQKQVENQLFSELSIVLNLERNEVEEYLKKQIEKNL